MATAMTSTRVRLSSRLCAMDIFRVNHNIGDGQRRRQQVSPHRHRGMQITFHAENKHICIEAMMCIGAAVVADTSTM